MVKDKQIAKKRRRKHQLKNNNNSTVKMISVKLQIDCLIKSNKIVIFLNEDDENEVANTLPKARLIYDQFKSNSFNHLFTTQNAQHKKSNKSTTTHQTYRSQVNLQIDIIKLLEMYGITKKHVTVIYLNQLQNPKLSEDYLKVSYCNDIILKYPLVFMHGIFFGSNDEIEFAHEEGFLFELFRDTGFYSLPDGIQMPPQSEYALTIAESSFGRFKNESTLDFEDIINNMENEYFDVTSEDQDYSLAIDKVVNINVNKFQGNKKFKSFSNIENTKRSKYLRNISSESFNDFNSDSSSLLSINKDSYCRHYVNNANLSSELELGIGHAHMKNKKLDGYDVDLKNLLSHDKHHVLNSTVDEKFVSVSNNSNMRKFTPPGDVLATINTWAKRTKEAINARNIQITKKNTEN